MLEEEKVFQILQKERIEAVIHFAGMKAVGESCEKPLEYYHNNVNGSLSLFRAMQKAEVKKLYLVLQQRFTDLVKMFPFQKPNHSRQPIPMVERN